MAFILEEAVADDTTDMLTNANTPKAFPGGHGRDTNDTSYGVRTEGMQGCFTHTQVSSVINQEGKLIRCIWIIIVCQMTITLSSVLLTEYVFLSFPRLKKEQVLLALFKVKKKKNLVPLYHFTISAILKSQTGDDREPRIDVTELQKNLGRPLTCTEETLGVFCDTILAALDGRLLSALTAINNVNPTHIPLVLAGNEG